jgi:hypothetical protein
MTSPKLAVILGAGASADVCPTPACVNNQDYRPPLVANLLTSKPFNALLNQHAEAAHILNAIRVEITTEGRGFEEALKARWNSADQHIRFNMRFVPLALRKFFFDVSQSYTFQPVNYQALVDKTVGLGIDTAFITVNYDTILERVLAGYRLAELDALAPLSPYRRGAPHFTFDSMDSYVSYPRWLLIKLHGSVDWGYRWSTEGDPRGLLFESDPPKGDADSIEVLPNPSELRDGRQAYYPALALPLPDKYGFVCPRAHQLALATFLAECHLFLFVGFSGKDHDLLDLLADTATSVLRFVIVSQGDVEEVKNRICSRVRAFAAVSAYSPTTLAFNDGFSHFVVRGLDNLVGESLALDR